MRDRPATVKGQYKKNISITSTMNPGIKLNVNTVQQRPKK
jgi:ribosomal protein L1